MEPNIDLSVDDIILRYDSKGNLTFDHTLEYNTLYNVRYEYVDIENTTGSIDYITLEGGQGMFTLPNILIIVLICIIVSKWIVPLINWKTAIRSFFHLIYKPVKRQTQVVSDEWTKTYFGGE